MDKQTILDVLNNLEVVDQQGGDEAWMLVDVTPEMIEELDHVGVEKETVLKYGDDESVCILALAFGEKYANFWHKGQLVNWPQEAVDLIEEMESALRS
ncbi:hypothetical protein [Paenibacillus sp. UASWS1643]|uniref:hypothetical protein n=1 Tax=Paenibacillus sp. UASWS1643 TaxID=2580422 RepID=UPI00123BFC8B|nr:hypothetical protein [Paenibacillus sp. UASWS1643]KAA8747134.1 hypothetical protein FE296_23395 [Paenibacillus sp. UASWS1643]